MTNGAYAAYKLPPIEYDLLQCLQEESEPMTLDGLWQEFDLLKSWSMNQIKTATDELVKRGMVSRLFPDGSKIVLTKYGRDVIEWRENTFEGT